MFLHPDRLIRSKIVSLGKQAKPLAEARVEAVLGYLAKTRHPTRNRLIFLLSIRAGLRAREIALLTWSMVTDAEGKIGHTIALRDATHTNAARKISLVDGSLKDVQMLAGHTSLRVTQRYITLTKTPNGRSSS
jgi:integrase/recombinase XerD